MKLNRIIIIPIFFSCLHAKAEGVLGLSVEVTYDTKQCPETNPLKVTVKNKTGKKLNGFDFSLKGYKPGYSTLVYNQYYSWEKKISRFGSDSLCYAEHFEENSIYRKKMTPGYNLSNIEFKVVTAFEDLSW